MTDLRDAELAALPSEIHDLLLRRSARISKPQRETDSEEDVMWIARFALGDQDYAIALPVLRAALPRRGITPVPHSSALVVGVLQFQGEVIALLDTAALLGSHWANPPSVLLVVDAGEGHTVALDCAQIPLATTLPLAAYREASAMVSGPLTSVEAGGRTPIVVIDLPRLLEKQDWAAA